MKALLLSPHCDDAVFSLGGSLLAGHINPAIVNIFTRSNYTVQSGVGPRDDNGYIELVTEYRLLEDEWALRKVGIRPKHLEFFDRSIRDTEYVGEYEIIEDEKFTEVFDTLAAIAQEYDTLYAPLALGDHRDHLLTRAIAKLIAHKEKKTLIYYEDVPYEPALDLDHVKEKTKNLASIIYDIDIEKKVELARCYRTQFDAEGERLMRRLHEDRGGERLWSTAFYTIN